MTWRSTIPRWLPEMYSNDPPRSWTEVPSVLKSRDIHYLLRHQSTLTVFSPPTPELDDALQRSATLVQEFNPYRWRRVHAGPVYDQNDAFYFPVGHFRAVVRPGPLVQLYRLDAAPNPRRPS